MSKRTLRNSSRRLDNLATEFDALLASMQKSKARKGMKAAFDASPAQLGRAPSKPRASSARHCSIALSPSTMKRSRRRIRVVFRIGVLIVDVLKHDLGLLVDILRRVYSRGKSSLVTP